MKNAIWITLLAVCVVVSGLLLSCESAGVSKTDIAQYEIYYEDWEFLPDTASSISVTLPDELSTVTLEYSLEPPTPGITVDDTGTISIADTVGAGSYPVTVSVTVAEADPQYTGSNTVDLPIELTPVAYKSGASIEGQKYFTIGDADYRMNAYLFTVRDLGITAGDLSRVTADISISSLVDTTVVLSDTAGKVSSFDDDGTLIVGIGLDMHASATDYVFDDVKAKFESLSNLDENKVDVSIKVIVNLDSEEYARKTTRVKRAAYNAAYDWTDIVFHQASITDKPTTAYTVELQQNITFPEPGRWGFDSANPRMMATGRSLNGNMHSIKNMKLLAAGVNDVGFVNDSEVSISKVTFINAEVRGEDRVSVLGSVGSVDDVTIKTDDKWTGGDTVVGKDDVGGLIHGLGTGRSLKNVDVRIDVQGTGDYVGGVLGRFSVAAEDRPPTLQKLVFQGGVTGTDRVGGLVGILSNSSETAVLTLEGYVTGGEQTTITATNLFSVGGLVGRLEGLGSITTRGYVVADVSGVHNTGGLVGRTKDTGTKTIEGYHIGKVTGTNFVGGLLGFANSPYTLNGYSRSTIVRIPGSNEDTFGYLLGGFVAPGTVQVQAITSGYHSTTESSFENISSNDASGKDGDPINVSATTTANDFSNLDFTSTGSWLWHPDGNWPAIKLVDHDAASQPIELAPSAP